MSAEIAMSPMGSDNSHPLDRIEADHVHLLELCDALENIADTLPLRAAGCSRVATELAILLPLHHADEDRGLFAVLRRKCPRGGIVQVMDRLASDHADDAAALMEVVDYLELLATPHLTLRPSPEAIGYAIRAFFQAKRRHLSLETRIIMPFAQDHLNPNDLETLVAIMQDNRKRTCTGTCGLCKAKLNSALDQVRPLDQSVGPDLERT